MKVSSLWELIFIVKLLGLGALRLGCLTIMEVSHVPELNKNLISLGVLDSSGYKYTSQVGALKVTKGSLVVMKVRKIRNLYK